MSLVIFIPLLLLPALFILWATIDSALASVHVRVRVGNLRRRLRYLGVGYSQDFPAESIEEVAILFRARMGKTALYDLRLKRHGRFSRTLLGRAGGREVAPTFDSYVAS